MADDAISLFRHACGAAGPLCVRVEGPGPGESSRRACARPFAVVGADGRADVPLDHPDVDPVHAYIQVLGGRVHWVDLGSRSGVLRDGRRELSGWLAPGRAIGVGPYAIRPGRLGPPDGPRNGHAAPAEPDPPDPLGPETEALDDLPTAALSFENRRGGPLTWRLGRELTLVGGARDCKIRLMAPDVARFHCALLRTTLGIWVVDLLGPGGVRVDGHPVRFARLGDGAEVRVGRFRCRLRYGRPPAVFRPQLALPSPSPSTGLRAGVPARPASRLGAARPMRLGQAAPRRLGEATPRRLGEAPPADGAGPALPPTIEALIAPLMDPSGRLRPDPSQEFHRAIRLMGDLIASMRPESTGPLGAGLRRLGQLTHELEALTVEVESARQLPAPPARPSALPPPRTSAPASAPALTLGRAEDDPHAWLTLRIEQVQKERQRLWQALLGALRDGGPGLAFT